MKFGVAQFPGSNCDQDAYFAIKDVLGQPVEYLWHKEANLKGSDVVIVPGGFSFGDYLRCGAIARFAPLMSAVQDFAANGGVVIGVCNGFQILCEAHLLPGALIKNEGTRFVCRHVTLKVENASTIFTNGLRAGQLLSIPVAHGKVSMSAPTKRSPSSTLLARSSFDTRRNRTILTDQPTTSPGSRTTSSMCSG